MYELLVPQDGFVGSFWVIAGAVEVSEDLLVDVRKRLVLQLHEDLELNQVLVLLEKHSFSG